MDFALLIFSLFLSFSLVVTTLAAVGFLVFLFLLGMESFEKKKLSCHVVSDFMSSAQRVS
jgi:hypothetical protein